MFFEGINRQNIPRSVANQRVIALISRVAEVAISIGIPCNERRPTELASAVPIPPGSNVNAPNKPEAVCIKIAGFNAIFASRALKIRKKLNPSRDQEKVAIIVHSRITFGFNKFEQCLNTSLLSLNFLVIIFLNLNAKFL